MILINLLPQEYRQRQRTPLKMMVAVAVSVAINASLLAYWAWTAFGVAAEVSSELAVLEDTMAGLNPQIAYHESLDKETKVFEQRESTLSEITSQRVNWTRKVDELIDVINKGGEGEKYLVWLGNLSVDSEINSRKKSFGTVEAQGNSGSPKFSHVANFLDDLVASPFTHDFNQPAPPEGSQSQVDPELVPSEVWSFPLELTLRDPKERGTPLVPQEEPVEDTSSTEDASAKPAAGEETSR